MALVYWFGVLLYWPLASPGLVLSLPTRPLLLLGCSVIFTLISYLSFAEALKRMEASRMGALVALSPLITMALVGLLALIRPGLVEIESLNELGVTGAVLVVVGAMCSSLGRSRGERS
jgi:drug/metabolite transporter (DMT)-like permease